MQYRKRYKPSLDKQQQQQKTIVRKKMTELSKLLTTLEYTDEEQKSVIPHIGTLRRLITTKKETLEANSDLSSSIIDKIMALKEWLLEHT